MLESGLNYPVVDLVSSNYIVFVVDNYSLVTKIEKMTRIHPRGVVTMDQRTCATRL